MQRSGMKRNSTSLIVAPAICFSALLALVLPGCGKGPQTTAVEGKVSYKGSPITFGIINFQPATGQPLGGEIRSDGTYRFNLPPGEYKVRIDSPPQLPEGLKEGAQVQKGGVVAKAPVRLLPADYAQYGSSGLTATVKAQSECQTIDFTLP